MLVADDFQLQVSTEQKLQDILNLATWGKSEKRRVVGLERFIPKFPMASKNRTFYLDREELKMTATEQYLRMRVERGGPQE